jgi:hypothetical protein
MKYNFTEKQVHEHIYQVGLETLIVMDFPASEAEPSLDPDDDELPFELWRVLKARAYARLKRLHNLMAAATITGSKVKLTTSGPSWMELDLIGYHDDGLFVLELKVNKSAERNAFSELFAYSNYVAEAFTGSGRGDITNVLVAHLDNEITRQAYLYDLLISGREVIVYRPIWEDTLESLRLELHLPSDSEFQRFSNALLSHDAMSCVVASFDDLDGWYDSKEDGGSLNEYTVDALSKVSTYAAQLMEAEGLHGFCFMRKPWRELPSGYRNSFIICALNPFRMRNFERADGILAQLKSDERDAFIDIPHMGFEGRLLRIAKRAIAECLEYGADFELETAYWGAMVTNMIEVVFNHKFSFRPTGMMREAFVSYLTDRYAARAAGHSVEDLELLQGASIYNWFKAWTFMEGCGFVRDDEEDRGE